MVVISKHDLERILDSVETKDAELCSTARKEQLKQASDERVSRWKDTLAAKRKAKLDWKAEKEKRDEEKRRVLDIEEAALRQKLRKETILGAGRLLREKTENVRQLRSQQLLVDTLETREYQIKERQRKNQDNIEEEKQWHFRVMNGIHEAEKQSQVNIEREKQKARSLADDMIKQRDEHEQHRLVQQRRRKDEEKIVVKKIVMDELQAGQAEFKAKVDRMNRAKEEMKDNEICLKQREQERLRQEQQETKKCQDDVTRRNQINAARAALERKHFEQKQSMRKALPDLASQELKQRAMREFEIFERDQRIINQREKERTEAAREKQKLEKQAVDESRRRQINLQKEQKEADIQIGKLYAEELNRVNLGQLEHERQKELTTRQQNMEIRKIQETKSRENEERRNREKKEALMQEQNVAVKLQAEDDLFKDFVMKEMENFQAKGKKTALLKRALKS